LIQDHSDPSLGFLAVAYTDSLIVVDMRGPRVILRHGRDKKKDRMSIHLHTPESANIASLTWTVATIENGKIVTIFVLGDLIIILGPCRSAASYSFDSWPRLGRNRNFDHNPGHEFPFLANWLRNQESGDCSQPTSGGNFRIGFQDRTSHSSNQRTTCSVPPLYPSGNALHPCHGWF
jgi:hypothetical protein